MREDPVDDQVVGINLLVTASPDDVSEPYRGAANNLPGKCKDHTGNEEDEFIVPSKHTLAEQSGRRHEDDDRNNREKEIAILEEEIANGNHNLIT